MSNLNSPPSPSRDDYINDQLTPSPRPSTDETACPICFEDYSATNEAVIRTHCNHTFHRECFVAWLGKEDINSANSCPNCRAVCFPKVEHKKETGLALDMSFLYNTMRTDYVAQIPAPNRPATRAVTDEEMMRMAFGDDLDAD